MVEVESSRGAQEQGSPAPPGFVNVNNRLIPEDTPLADGDYVVLARQPVRI